MSSQTWKDGENLKSADQLSLLCTFALRRSHPQPQHCAPTTGLDPSPLQDLFLLIRSLHESDVPGFQTFTPCSDRLVTLSWSSWKKHWVRQLKHFGTQEKVHFNALRSSKAPQTNWAFTELCGGKEVTDAVWCFRGASLKIRKDFLLWFKWW